MAGQIFFLRHLLGALVFGGRQVLVQEFLDLAFGHRAHEAVHRLAIHQQHAGRDAADAESGRQLLLLVGIDLDQLEAAAVLGLDLFQQRTEDLARPAPGRPEIHQDWLRLRRVDDFGFKVFEGDVDHSS